MPIWDEMLEVVRRMQARTAREEQVEWGAQVRPGGLVPAFAPIQGADAKPCARKLQLSPFTWGYTLPDNGRLVYNARIENSSGPLWASSFANRRAIVPAATFFEPHETETERNPITGRMGKRPYAFRSPSGDSLLLGAVYQDGRISVVTTEPNESVAGIHRRMPLVLAFEEVPLWLGGQWEALADRSAIELASAPEHPATSSLEQLSLFDS